VFGVLRGPQRALDTCGITEACYWVAMSKFVSRSVSLVVERRSFYSDRLLCKYDQGDVEVMPSNVVGPRLAYFLGTIPSAVCQYGAARVQWIAKHGSREDVRLK